MDAVEYANQYIIYFAIGEHQQNGISESRITNITLVETTIILHVRRHWHESITTMLCPLDLLSVEGHHNVLKFDADVKSPLDICSDIQSNVGIKDFHILGCLVYAIDSRIQDGLKNIPKWDPRSRSIIYLGHSTVNANSMTLVLNPMIGHISPKFNCFFMITLPLYHK